MPIPFLSVIDVRAMIRDELRRAGLVQDAQKPGLPVVFHCECGNKQCSAELTVSPHGAAVHLGTKARQMTLGVVLDQEQRDALADILTDADWTGDHPDLGP